MTSALDIKNDPTFGALISAVKEDILKFKTADSEWVAANGDREAQLQAYIQDSQDPDAVQIREALEKLTQRLKDLAEQNVQTSEVDEATKEKLVKARNEARTQVRNTIKSVQDTAGLFERTKGLPYVDTFNEWLKEFGDPTKTRNVSSGTALPKVPVEVKVRIPEHGDVAEENLTFYNFTDYGKWASKETKDVHAEVLSHAPQFEGDLTKLSGTPEGVSYQVQRGALTVDVRVLPKATKPRGRKPQAAAAE